MKTTFEIRRTIVGKKELARRNVEGLIASFGRRLEQISITGTKKGFTMAQAIFYSQIEQMLYNINEARVVGIKKGAEKEFLQRILAKLEHLEEEFEIKR